MPRRRLYGETQKRRKKPVTRDLKRKETIVRPQVTRQPAAFERSETLGREDLEFQEAMRELDVSKTPWSKESPRRRQAVEGVQFKIDEADQTGFAAHMEHMGVRPLGGREGAAPKEKERLEGGGSQAAPPAPSGPPGSVGPPGKSRAGAMEADPAARTGFTEEKPPPVETPERPAAGGPRPFQDSEPGATFTTFAEDEPGGASMEDLLAAAEFDPGHKFEGAPRAGTEAETPPGESQRRGGAGAAFSIEHMEPDSELDLHGKTQEEAIAMVQNFLLTCHRQRLRHVLIITGKGLNSGSGGPVLREAVQRWMERNGASFASGFFNAPPRHGGEGAIWVTLR